MDLTQLSLNVNLFTELAQQQTGGSEMKMSKKRLHEMGLVVGIHTRKMRALMFEESERKTRRKSSDKLVIVNIPQAANEAIVLASALTLELISAKRAKKLGRGNKYLKQLLHG